MKPFVSSAPGPRGWLMVAGLIQPDSGSWGLVDQQTRLYARFVRAWARQPDKAERFRCIKAEALATAGPRGRYLDTPRHALEVEHYAYGKRLAKLERCNRSDPSLCAHRWVSLRSTHPTQ